MAAGFDDFKLCAGNVCRNFLVALGRCQRVLPAAEHERWAGDRGKQGQAVGAADDGALLADEGVLADVPRHLLDRGEQRGIAIPGRVQELLQDDIGDPEKPAALRKRDEVPCGFAIAPGVSARAEVSSNASFAIRAGACRSISSAT